MRFYHKAPYSPKAGDVRLKRRFLWFPKRIGFETRWLEVAYWEERYWNFPVESGWVPEKWCDYKTTKK